MRLAPNGTAGFWLSTSSPKPDFDYLVYATFDQGSIFHNFTQASEKVPLESPQGIKQKLTNVKQSGIGIFPKTNDRKMHQYQFTNNKLQ